jgi:predicted alpha/beta-hydrolase family hydrolase
MSGPSEPLLPVYAPGAGSNVNDPFGTFACCELAAGVVSAVRFQLPYQEARRRTPDATRSLKRPGAA